MILSIFNYILRFVSFFQAYDESWKTSAPVEAHWGLYYEGSRTPKFDFDISSYSKLILFGLNLMYGSFELNIFVYFFTNAFSCFNFNFSTLAITFLTIVYIIPFSCALEVAYWDHFGTETN